ncbi:hypothetical protein DTO280E4_2572 [Paecilomyces variotii]|nr:hypothetical protein DTO280E4_2572 [Paecilomyces variotii]
MLIPLLEIFVQETKTERLRRWTGQLFLELLCDSSDNKELLALGAETLRRRIGHILCYGSELTLRYLAGCIIREMRVTEYDRQLFDNVEVNDQLNDFFKESETPGSEWITSCCTFIHGKRNGIAPWLIKSINLEKHITSRNSIVLVHTRESLVFIILRGRPTWQQPRFIEFPFHSIIPEEPCVSYDEAEDTNIKIRLKPGGHYVMNGKKMYAESMSIDFVCNSYSQEIVKAITIATKEVLTDHKEIKHSRLSYSTGDQGPSPRHASQVVVHLNQMESVDYDKGSVSRITETCRPDEALRQPLIRRSGSIVVSLDAGTDVTRKSLVSRNQATENKRPFLKIPSGKGDIDNQPKEKEGDENLEWIARCETFVQSISSASEAGHLTKDVEPEAVKSFEDDSEVAAQGDRKEQDQREGQYGEENYDDTAEDIYTGADASPCDPMSSLDPLHSQQQFHLSLPGTFTSEQTTIGITDQVKAMAPGVIPDSQEEQRSTMNTNIIEQGECSSANNSDKTKAKSGLKPLPRGHLKQLLEHKIVTTDSVDWDEDLRIPASELELPNSKTKRSPAHLPSPGGSRKKKPGPSSRNKNRPKISLPTPKTGTASSKKSRASEKPPVQNTLASRRPRRAAADEAKIKILCDYNQDEDVDDDPIRDSTPDDSLTFGNSFQFDQKRTSTPRLAHTDQAGNAETKTPVIDLTTASDGLDNVDEEDNHQQQDVSLQSVRDTPASSENALPAVGNDNRENSSRVEEDQEDRYRGRGHLIGSKLAAVLGQHGVLSSDQVDKDPREAECEQPRTSPAIVGYDQQSERKERLAKISSQISDFISGGFDNAPGKIHETPDLSGLSEESERVHLKTTDHIVHKATENEKQTGDGTSSTDNRITLRNSEGVSIDSDKESSKSIRPVASKAAKIIGHPYAALIDERLHRKTQIVSFSADGPRNQCEIRPSSSVKRLRSPQLQSNDKTENQFKRKAVVQQPDDLTRPTKRLRFEFGGSSDMDEAMDSTLSATPGHIHTISSPSPLKMNQCRGSIVDENGSPHPVSRTATQIMIPGDHVLLNRDGKRPTVPHQDSCDEPATESSPLSYVSKDAGVDYRIRSKGQSVGKRSPQARALFPPSRASKIANKQNDDVELAGRGSQRQSNPLFISQRRMPNQTREERTLPFSKRLNGDQAEIRRVQGQHIANEQEAQLSTFWDSISSPKKIEAKTDVTAEPRDEINYGRGSTVESSSPSGLSQTSESITLVEPEGQETQFDQLRRASHGSTLDILVDTSERLVCHLVEEEDAVWDVLETYDHGCRRLIDQLTEAHNESLEAYERAMTAMMTEYKEVREKTLERLKARDKVLKALPTTDKLASGMKKWEKLLTRLQDLSTAYDAKLDALEAPE